jgi:hypothetical protein
MSARVPAVEQAPAVALAASSDTSQEGNDKIGVTVEAPPPRRKRFSLNIFSFLKSKPQAPEPNRAPDLSTITCCHCKQTGLRFSHHVRCLAITVTSAVTTTLGIARPRIVRVGVA